MYEIPKEMMELYEMCKPYIKKDGGALVDGAPDPIIDAFEKMKAWGFSQAQ